MKQKLVVLVIIIATHGVAILSRTIGGSFAGIGFFICYFLGSLLLKKVKSRNEDYFFLLLPFGLECLVICAFPTSIFWLQFILNYASAVIAFLLAISTYKMVLKVVAGVCYCSFLYVAYPYWRYHRYTLSVNFQELSLTDIEQRRIDPTAIKAKLIYVDLWSTSCGLCIEKMTEIEEVKKSFGTEVSFINLDVGKDYPEAIEKFYQKYGFTTTPLIDQGDLLKKLPENTTPQTLIFDHNGNCIYYISGYDGSTVEESIELINDLLKK